MLLIYMYCISTGIEVNELMMECQSISGERHVGIMPFRDIQAVVSMVEEDDFSDEKLKKNLDNMEWVAEKAFAHENIIEEVMGNHPVIPLQFCTLYKTDESLMRFLESYYDQIKSHLSLAGKSLEWGVKVFCNTGILKERILAKPSVMDEIDSINRKPKGIAFMLTKKFHERIENSIQNTMNADIQSIFGEVNSIMERVVVKEVLDCDDVKKKMVLNIVALLEKTNTESLAGIINALNRKYGEDGYSIESSGPWPIYHFISFDENT
jgi:hypothetical protein